jgi:hypothetical protein
MPLYVELAATLELSASLQSLEKGTCRPKVRISWAWCALALLRQRLTRGPAAITNDPRGRYQAAGKQQFDHRIERSEIKLPPVRFLYSFGGLDRPII